MRTVTDVAEIPDVITVEYEEPADRSISLKILTEEGEVKDYIYQPNDVKGMFEKVTKKPFNPTINKITREVKDEMFYVSDEGKSAYEEIEEGIPLDVELPDGLIFQVQIGAFYRPVDPKVFGGFAPLNGEKSSTGMIRYRAGIFKIFDTANNAKNEIRSKGYSDAFVVAFLNGERIPLYEARELLDPQIVDKYNYIAESANIDLSQIPVNDVVNDDISIVTKDPIENLEDLESDKGSDPIEDTTGDDPKITTVEELTSASRDGDELSTVENPLEVENIGGLFFTVQVGVYSHTVAKSALYNIDPINSQRTDNNRIRYTSGVFSKFEEADLWKTNIRGKGISDAFVTAYKDGVRISMAEARGISKQIKSPVIPIKEKVKINEEEKAEADVWNDFNEKVISENPDISFRLRLGPYKGKVPMSDAHVILELKDNINFEMNADGEFQYTSIKKNVL